LQSYNFLAGTRLSESIGFHGFETVHWAVTNEERAGEHAIRPIKQGALL
jgi:hypothetical protein